MPEGLRGRGRIVGTALLAAVLVLVLVVVVAPKRPDRRVAAPTPTLPPTATLPPGSKVVTVTSIRALLASLADDTIDEIVVADGTYPVTRASAHGPDSLWIGAAYAGRTRPIIVRAETPGGVTFDGGGTDLFGCISFEEGAHDQVWDGFNCANGRANSTGVVVFGGYAGKPAPHHITMSHITIEASCTGSASSAEAPATDHAFYISEAIGGPHDLVFSEITVDGRGGLATAFHFNHSEGDNLNGWNITVQRLHVTGTQQAIMLWDETLHDVTFDDVDIVGALRYAIRYEFGSRITVSDAVSDGSGSGGFYSSKGARPAEITFIDATLQ